MQEVQGFYKMTDNRKTFQLYDLLKATEGLRKFQEDKLRIFMELAKLIWSEEHLKYFSIEEKGVPDKVILPNSSPDIYVDAVVNFCSVCFNEDVKIPIPIYMPMIDRISFEAKEIELLKIPLLRAKVRNDYLVPKEFFNSNTP